MKTQIQGSYADLQNPQIIQNTNPGSYFWALSWHHQYSVLTIRFFFPLVILGYKKIGRIGTHIHKKITECFKHAAFEVLAFVGFIEYFYFLK